MTVQCCEEFTEKSECVICQVKSILCLNLVEFTSFICKSSKSVDKNSLLNKTFLGIQLLCKLSINILVKV